MARGILPLDPFVCVMGVYHNLMLLLSLLWLVCCFSKNVFYVRCIGCDSLIILYRMARCILFVDCCNKVISCKIIKETLISGIILLLPNE